jgi:hypothetical protein
MRLTLCLSAALVLCACSQETAAPPVADNEAVDVNAPAATPAALQLNETTWTFTDKDGTKVKESIDANGNYIATSLDGKHIDHGTSRVDGDKACFTSAMNKDGEICWTAKPVEIGQSMDVVSDKGETLTVTRVAYEPQSMPK